MSHKPLGVAIIGMGGFARNHHFAVQKLEQTGEVRLLATCDPQPDAFASSQLEWNLAPRGVRVFSDYLEMLNACGRELDFVCIPTPIPLHAPMHRACIERSLACYLEKPPTLSWAELEDMLRVEKRAPYPTQVGFNFIAELPRRNLKRRLLLGEFGRLKRAGFLGCWPRATSYFSRAPWAGRLMLNDRLVLDSCTGNAMAHFIHNLLFWCGQDEELSWGEVESVEAQLYRAHAIESFDTVFARGVCEGAVEIRVAATHAASGASWQREWLDCEEATLEYDVNTGYSIFWNDGREERGPSSRLDLLVENLRHFVRTLRGEENRPLTRLQDARPFVYFNNLLFVSARQIHALDASFLTRNDNARGGEFIAINDIERALEEFAGDGKFPDERGLAWGRAGGRATLAQLPQLESVVRGMLRPEG